MITYHFTFNLQDARMFDSNMELVTGDVGAYGVEISFLDNKKAFDISGYTFSVRAVRADETVLTDAGTIENNRAVYTLKNAMYAVPGDLILEFALSDEKGNYVTAKIVRAIVLSGAGEGDVVQDETNTYVTLLAQMTERLKQADALLTALDIDLTGIQENLEKKVDAEEVNTTLLQMAEALNAHEEQLKGKADAASIEGALLHQGRVESFDAVPENANHVYAVGGKIAKVSGKFLDLFYQTFEDFYEMDYKNFVQPYSSYMENEGYQYTAYFYNPDGTYICEGYNGVAGGTELSELMQLYSANDSKDLSNREVTFYISPVKFDFRDSGAAFYDGEAVVKLPSEVRVSALEHSLGNVNDALLAILKLDDTLLGGGES